MDTKPEIPDFKLAKVGTDRRRKGAGFAWFGNGGGGGAALAKGGAGLAGLMGKLVIVGLVGAIGLGAFSVGRGLAPSHANKKKKSKAFAGAQKFTEDISNLPKDVKYDGKSGLGMVAGRMDGKTAEELAAERAEAERLAREAADAEAAAAAEAEKQAAEEVAGVPGDPAAAMAAAAAAAGGAGGAPGADKGGMGRKYGELSKSFGGLAGGGGVSGGFAAKKFSAKDGKALAFSQRAAPSRSGATPARFNSRSRGLARKQLDKAVFFSKNASRAGNESSSEQASQAFDGGVGAGTAIGGAGAGTGAGVQGSGNGDGSTSSGGSPTYGLGGSGDPFGPCRTGQTVAENPNCAREDPGTGDDDPTNSIIKILQTMLIIATILGIIQLILSKMTWGPYDYIRLAIMKFIYAALMLLGAAICILGIMLMGMGRLLEGGIFAVIGAIMAYMAYQGSQDMKQAAEEAAKKSAEETAKKVADEAALREYAALRGGVWA